MGESHTVTWWDVQDDVGVKGLAVCRRVELHTVTWWNVRDDEMERSG
ncbi:MAG: hypothetical protein LKK12_05855 [Bacteroidales bacterium]|nr:hypothetical protein [Bacteroidales bacterium]MCI2133892.1 hypothetical protein [Bacteroidales bacterium]